MQQSETPEAIERFVEQVTLLLDSSNTEASFLPKIGEAMRTLVSTDDWLRPELARPHPRHYQQYFIHAAPEDRFSVVSFVWGPGQETPIHDHTVWGVIGMLRGMEISQSYEISADGLPRAQGDEVELAPGAVEFVSPRVGDVHKVRNPLSTPSISIHAYGADIGKVRRHVFPPEGGAPKPFVSGYSNVDH